MGIGMYLLFKLFDFKLDTSRTMYVILLAAVTAAYGALSYWVGSRVFKIEEVYIFEKWIKKMLHKIFGPKSNEESI
jgi:transposase-like protein